MTPGDQQAKALLLDGDGDYVATGDSYVNKRRVWTLSLRFNPWTGRGATLYSEGTATQAAFNLNLTTNGQVQVEVWDQASGQYTTFTTTNATDCPNLAFAHRGLR